MSEAPEPEASDPASGELVTIEAPAPDEVLVVDFPSPGSPSLEPKHSRPPAVPASLVPNGVTIEV